MQLVLVQPPLRMRPDADNLDVIRRRLEAVPTRLGREDIVLLPETVDRRPDPDPYERGVRALARALGCHVVGGSHRAHGPGGVRNAGLVADPAGRVLARYEKLRPYADERREVRPGTVLGEFTIGRCRVLVLVCADFWFADLLQRTSGVPDLVLVPALSVTRKPTPAYSRALWRHFAVCRAYEFGAYVGVSDWARTSVLPAHATSGVGGFADPTVTEPARLFSPIGAGGVAVHRIDLRALDAFRRDRLARGFFWRAPAARSRARERPR
jgi:predicted amidohydrolase